MVMWKTDLLETDLDIRRAEELLERQLPMDEIISSLSEKPVCAASEETPLSRHCDLSTFSQ